MNLRSNYLDIADIALGFMAACALLDLEFFFVIAWSLWCSRNLKVFEANFQTPDQVWSFARRLIQDYKEASNLCNCGTACADSKWRAPTMGMYKINVDGATSEDSRPSSIGVIIRDNRSETIAAMCMSLPGQYRSLGTETIAIEKGVLLAKEIGLQEILLETDAFTVAQSLAAGDKGGCLGHFIPGISENLRSFTVWQINHLRRDCNKVAHELAQFAKRSGTNQVWKGVSPPMVQHLLQLDKT